MKTYMAKPEEVKREWFLIDCAGLPLGRVATTVADILTGKNKPTFTPHVDTGDFVVVINTDKLVLTGKKLEQKVMRHHTGYVGGLKEIGYDTLMKKNSVLAFEKAVKGMLPKTTLGRKQITRLKAYKDDKFVETAQAPKAVAVKGVR
jgi:large subunit ribosomal protein L13